MQPQTMAGIGEFFFVLYIVCVITLIIYFIRLVGRFVGAHERMAASLDIIAQKMKDEARP